MSNSLPVADSVKKRFDLSGRVAVITGGAGFLGLKHAAALAEMGAVPVLLDVRAEPAEREAALLARRFGVPASGLEADITDRTAVELALRIVLERHGRIDILINNAAHNPKVEGGSPGEQWSRTRCHFPLDVWQRDLAVGLTGAFLCSQVFGAEMARHGKGVILNIASDLARNCARPADLPHAWTASRPAAGEIRDLFRGEAWPHRFDQVPGHVLGGTGGAGECALARRCGRPARMRRLSAA